MDTLILLTCSAASAVLAWAWTATRAGETIDRLKGRLEAADARAAAAEADRDRFRHELERNYRTHPSRLNWLEPLDAETEAMVQRITDEIVAELERADAGLLDELHQVIDLRDDQDGAR